VRTHSPGHVDVARGAAAMTDIRDRVAAVLAAWGLHDVDDVLLVVSELVSNALRYGGEVVRVSLDRRARSVLVSVVDTSPILPSAHAAADDDEHGRGLRLVAAVSTRWGAEPWRDGKRVWAQVHLQ
jgi:anti-sigma regulatory factor (Ser/Thr protein kinase)